MAMRRICSLVRTWNCGHVEPDDHLIHRTAAMVCEDVRAALNGPVTHWQAVAIVQSQSSRVLCCWSHFIPIPEYPD